MSVGDIIATIAYVCLACSCVSVLLRIVVRYKWLDAGLKLDDWFMIVALIWYLAFCAAIIAFATIEKQNPVLTEPVANRLLLVLALGEALFMLTSISLKLSLMIFFRQFILERKERKVMTYVTAVYCVMSGIGIFLGLFPCGAPIRLATKRVNHQCMPTALWNGLLYTHGAVSALSDWTFALLPILVLWKSSMPARTKLGVSLLMVFAVCGSLCALLRTIYTGTLHFDERYYDVNHKPNYYHVTALVINMAILEMGIGITTASVACLMPLFRRCAGWGRRHLTARFPPNDIEGRNGDGMATTTGGTSSRQGRKLDYFRPRVASFQSGNLEMEMLGVLPSLDSTTGPGARGDLSKVDMPEQHKSSYVSTRLVP